jgi:hypothetical protein
MKDMSLRKRALRHCIALLLLTPLAFAACKTQPGPDLLKGKWKIIHVLNGTEEFGGPAFHGADFYFRDNGTVLVTQYSGDTTVSNYERRGDSLIYLNPAGNESYSLDSLTANKLVISAVMGGVRKRVEFVRLKD